MTEGNSAFNSSVASRTSSWAAVTCTRLTAMNGASRSTPLPVTVASVSAMNGWRSWNSLDSAVPPGGT